MTVYSYQYQDQLMAVYDVQPAAVTSKVQQVLQATGEVTAVQGAFIQAKTGKPFPLQMFVTVNEALAPRALSRVDGRLGVTMSTTLDGAAVNMQLVTEALEGLLDKVSPSFNVQIIWTEINEATSDPALP